jgi:hypothetical protein
MINFELRDAIRNSIDTSTEGEVKFNITVVVGVVGNTYSGFLNSEKQIIVTCPKTMTGDEMENKVTTDCVAFVAANFPSI